MSGKQFEWESCFAADSPQGNGHPSATIFALSSGLGRAGVAVIRISGELAGKTLFALTGKKSTPRRAELNALHDPQSGKLLDRALTLWFPGPHSFTGEDVAELHIHGGRAVISAVLESLGALQGLRLAEPGEFSRRAFENGKLDLTAAEGLADLINAETESQRELALRQASGAQQRQLNSWRDELVRLLSLVEAAIDFSDEADIADDVIAPVWQDGTKLLEEITAYLDDGHCGEILRDGFKVVIAGPPNAGKSSLLNALAQRDVAIVSDEAGTTRDVIEVKLDVQGVPVILSDTAGIRAAPGAVEREGIRRALTQIKAADLVIWLHDALAGQPIFPDSVVKEAASEILQVVNKCDLLPQSSSEMQAIAEDKLLIAAKQGIGIEALLEIFAERVTKLKGAVGAAPITRARHRQELQKAQQALAAFTSQDRTALELRAEDLRVAARAIGRITGEVDVEEILGKIFSDFCIGK